MNEEIRALPKQCENGILSIVNALSITTQVFQYKSIILPQLRYGAPIWYHRNVEKLQTFPNSVIRSVFKHGPSPSIHASQELIGQPPVDILCGSNAIKFAIRLKENNDLVHYSHQSALCRSRVKQIS